MTSDSKILFFFISLLITISLSSCKKNKNDVIPDVYVYFVIDLNDPEFVNLNGFGGSVTVNYNTNNLGQPAAGYDNNGIIIFNNSDEFFAYDRTCPHDFVVNGLSMKVNVVDIIYAECPECKTRYALPANGTPSSGIGRYPLKNYRTRFDGRFITVTNK
jgi:hypothetical protein